MTFVPPELARLFEPPASSTQLTTLLAIDAQGTILWTNDSWFDFARANGGAAVIAFFRVGRSYYEGIHGAKLRGFYRKAFTRALRTQRVYEQDYECSSRDLQRLVHLRAMPLTGSCLLLEHSLVHASPHRRPAQEAVLGSHRTATGAFVQCSYCRRMRRGDTQQWDWVPSWLERVPAPTCHGVCAVCRTFYLA